MKSVASVGVELQEDTDIKEVVVAVAVEISAWIEGCKASEELGDIKEVERATRGSVVDRASVV